MRRADKMPTPQAIGTSSKGAILESIRSVVLTRRTVSHASFAVLIGVAAAAVGACGSKNAPSGPSRTIVDLRITGPNALLIGQRAVYTATATYFRWRILSGERHMDPSSTAVGEISSAGQLTAWTTGTTNVSATFDGRTATLGVQVTNPLVGQWVLTASANPGSPSGINTRIKTYTENEWLIEQSTAGGAIVFRHGGHYTLRGTAYVETVEFANPNTANLIGLTFTGTVNVSDNQFTQSAPLAETWTRVQ
jgi:hypothetical protein